MPVVCDLYARVSTTEQAQEGYSLAEQEERLRAYAKAQGWKIHACHVDAGFSGAKLERPGLQSVIADATAHRIQRVVTYKLDRLSRSQKDTLHLIEDVFLQNGVDYVSMTEAFDTGTPVGRAVLGLLACFAQLERETIRERMTMGRVAAVKSGNWRGGAGMPFGYRYVSKAGNQPGQLVPDEIEAMAVRRMFDLFLQGNNYSEILRKIRSEFVLPGRGMKTTGNAVAKILQNRIYIGDMYFKGEYYKGDFDHIVTDEVFWAVQRRMAAYQTELENNRKQPQHRGHLLTGYTFCGCCGGRVSFKSVPHTKKNGELSAYNSYVCTAKQHKGSNCPNSSQWQAKDLENIILDQVEKLRFEDMTRASPSIAPELEAIEKRIAAIDRQQEKLVELFSIGSIRIEVIEKQSGALAAEREKLTERATLLRASNDTAIVETFREAVDRVKDIRSMSESDQRSVLRVLIKRITMYPDRRIDIEWNI